MYDAGWGKIDLQVPKFTTQVHHHHNERSYDIVTIIRHIYRGHMQGTHVHCTMEYPYMCVSGVRGWMMLE